MAMNNAKYYDSLSFSASDVYDYYGYSKHNLNGKYKKLSGYLGRADGSIMGNATFEFYGDGKLLEKYNLYANDMPKKISVDVTGIINLVIRVYLDRNGYNGTITYAFADATIE